MVNLFPVSKQQQYPVFSRFNALYGESLVAFCPPLSKFEITILTEEEFRTDTKGLPPIEDVEKQAFSFSSIQTEDKAESTRAGIIVSQAMIDVLNLTEEEQLAAIAHEIGHIILRFSEHKHMYSSPQGEEIYVDNIAC